MSIAVKPEPVSLRRARWQAVVEQAREQSLANRTCERRVRHEARDALGVIAFSALASTGVSVVLTVVMDLVA